MGPAAPAELAGIAGLTRLASDPGMGSSALLEAALDLVRDLTPADASASWRLDERKEALRLELARGWEGAPSEVATDTLDAHTTLTPAPAGTVWEPDPAGPAAGAGFRAAVVAPIPGVGRRDGALAAYAKDRNAFDDEHRELLSATAAILGLARARMRADRLEDELDRVEHQASAAALVSGVSHDFSNILSVILSYARLIATDGSASSTVLEWVGEIETAASRGSQITRRMVDLGRQASVPAARIETLTVLEDLGRILLGTLGNDVQLRLDVAADVPDVMLQPGDFERIVLNLVLNSRDALPGRGRIVVAADVDLSDGLPGWVVLSVSDDGEGMSEEVRARAFDPDFSTKRRAGGSGVGLSNVRGIVTAAGGEVSISSAEGAGTTVTVRLPGARRPDSYSWVPRDRS